MEDEVITTAAPQSDVVVTANTSPENTAGYSSVQEPTVDPSQSSAISVEQPTPPAPKTEREIAYEEINRRQEANYYNKGDGISNWIQSSYDYDAEQAGTLWVAGKINDVKTQMSFLEATLNEDLYSEMDLQKYFFDTNLATARAYAKEKKHETAYGFYRAAEEKAVAEGQLTGWYMPAEAGYMLSQWVLADEKLKDSSISTVDKARAESVRRAVSGWFAANNITERGIECLNHMYLQETIRHNKEMERLQDDANQIQKAANEANNKANDANYKIQKETFNFQLAEMERDMGYDLNNDNIIGHTGADAQRFGFYKDQKDWVMGNLGTAFSLWGSDHVRSVLGDEYQGAYLNYENDRIGRIFKSEIEASGAITPGSNAFINTGRKTGDDKEVCYTIIGNEIVVGYFDEGAWIPITDKELEFSTGENINDYIKNIFGKDMNIEGINSITINGKTYDIGSGENTKNKISVTNMIETGWVKNYINNNIDTVNSEKSADNTGSKNDMPKVIDKMLESETSKGTKDKNGKKVYNLRPVPDKWDCKNINEFTIMKGTDNEGNIKYYSVTQEGELKPVNENDLRDVPSPKELEIGTNGYGFHFKESKYAQVVKASWVVGYDKENERTIMALPHSDGTVEYYALKGDQTKGYNDGGAKIVANDLTEQDVIKANLNVLKAPDQEKNPKGIQDNHTGDPADPDDLEVLPMSNTSNTKTGNTTARTIAKSEGKKQESKATTLKNKSEEEQVLEDYDRYVTAFAAGEVKDQIESIDENLRRQLGGTWV